MVSANAKRFNCPIFLTIPFRPHFVFKPKWCAAVLLFAGDYSCFSLRLLFLIYQSHQARAFPTLMSVYFKTIYLNIFHKCCMGRLNNIVDNLNTIRSYRFCPPLPELLYETSFYFRPSRKYSGPV